MMKRVRECESAFVLYWYHKLPHTLQHTVDTCAHTYDQSMYILQWLQQWILYVPPVAMVNILRRLDNRSVMRFCATSKAVYIFCRKYMIIKQTIYVFGDNNKGRLGDGNTDRHDVHDPLKLNGSFQGMVNSVSGSVIQSAFVTTHNELYTFGVGQHGVLCDGDSSNHTVEIPVKVRNDVKYVACASRYTVYCTTHGNVYMCGRILNDCNNYKCTKLNMCNDCENYKRTELNRDFGVPLKIDLPNLYNVVGISCGNEHTALWTDNGYIFMFGQGRYGVLGNGNANPHVVKTPLKIDGPFQGYVKGVSCGNYHTGLWTYDGIVFLFGNNGECQIDGDIHNTPLRVVDPMYINGRFQGHVKGVSCGYNCTALWTHDGHVLMFGCGLHGKLGDDIYKFHVMNQPTHIDGVFQGHVKGVSCGYYYTIIWTCRKMYIIGTYEYARYIDNLTTYYISQRHYCAAKPLEFNMTDDSYIVDAVCAYDRVLFRTCEVVFEK